jgi:hypothetical protein
MNDLRIIGNNHPAEPATHDDALALLIKVQDEALAA